jgi:hypothetical protein
LPRQAEATFMHRRSLNRRQFLAAGATAAAVAQAAPTAAVVLANGHWLVEIDPPTLALRVHVAGQPALQLSRGVGPHEVSGLAATERNADWVWQAGAATFHVHVELQERDLALRIAARQAGTLVVLHQPPAAMGRALLLPLADGRRIPPADGAWQDFLVDEAGELQTTEDLSLPLIGMDHGAFTLHWLLTEAFHNHLSFTREAGSLALRLTHQFTPLAPRTPLVLQLHLGGPDPLAGAKRYRHHLVSTGRHEPLAAKIARTPGTHRLIGATHLYLWGNGLIGPQDVRDWPGFVRALRTGAALSAQLRAVLEADAAELLGRVPQVPSPGDQRALIQAFNAALQALARRHWQDDDAATSALLQSYAGLRREVARTFGQFLAPDPASWGDGLSLRTLRALQRKGPARAWIGLGDGWEGGLWHPGTVRAIAAAGHLVGPYDSYETALPPGERPDWATAQLGRAVYERCGVVRQDGSVAAGFQQAGHYNNSRCVMPRLQDRVSGIARAAGFNSWFLDVSATGMVFDDYRPGHEMTMAQNAEANESAQRWIAEELQLPLGSEDGKAVTSRGIAFAHGLQTVPFGWGDADVQRNAGSPYFRGGWYPAARPGIFFKPAQTKATHALLHFAPQHRLPLHAAVFHGAFISTHHWLYDNLKLPDVRAVRELTQLLYNAPPLFHLSSDTLQARLPAIRRHDAFFRPVHEALALTTLEGFAWLDDDGLLQATTFSDGSTLIANFSASPRRARGASLPPLSITAFLANRRSLTYTSA